ncbi:hypothetical protein KR49_13975 [Synechococcus sp. KORDI-49]|nr:hypothetical protein KR49_13975 [Synechococcus sp. KORDI-49]
MFPSPLLDQILLFLMSALTRLLLVIIMLYYRQILFLARRLLQSLAMLNGV